MLLIDENANLVISTLSLLNLLQWYIITDIYAYTLQTNANGQTIQDLNQVTVKYTPLGAFFFELQYPPTTPIIDNLATKF